MAVTVQYSIVFLDAFDNQRIIIPASDDAIALPTIGQTVHISSFGQQMQGTVEQISYELSAVPGQHGSVYTIAHGVRVRQS